MSGLVRFPLRAGVLGALLALAAILAYHNSFTGPFVFDDLSSIPANPSLHSFASALSPPIGSSLTVEGRPLLNVSFALNRALGGFDVRGYHAVNLVIHILAALALFGLVHRTLRSPALAADFGPAATLLAFAAALVWTVHPLQTESVTYIVQRAESLMGLFYFATLYLFARGTVAGASPCWLAGSVFTCLLGMATKEVMATAPLLVLLYDRTFIARGIRAAWRQRRAYYVSLAGTWLLLGWLVAGSGGNRSGIMGLGVGSAWSSHLLSQAEAFARYLSLVVWPSPLVFEYGWFRPKPVADALAWLLVAGPLIAGTAGALKFRPVLGFAGAWFFLILAPASLTPSTTQLFVEHRLYVPLAGPVVLAALALYRCVDAPQAAPRRTLAIAGMVALALGGLTVRRNYDYRTDLALWQDTVAKRPASALAHHLLAEAWENAGGDHEAIEHYEASRRLRPEFALAHGNLGRLLLRLGREDEAMGALEQALRLQPDFAAAREAMGVLLTRRGRAGEAIPHLRAVLAYDPRHDSGHFNLAVALAKAGQFDEAVFEYGEAIKLTPDDFAPRFNRANLLRDRGRNDEAILAYQDALRLQPDHPQAHNNLANTLASTGRYAAAIEHYRAALRSRSDYVEAHYNLAATLHRIGQLDEAATHYETVLRLNPNAPAAKAALERIYAVPR